MKVRCLNSSALKTRNIIKDTFAKLINEKKQLEKITVTELVNRAGITRSTFYTHYGNIYEVAKEYQLQTIELLCSKDLHLVSKEDVLSYFDNILTCLKDNEETYKLLLAADESLLFLNKLKDHAQEKVYEALKKGKSDAYLNLNLAFLMDGLLVEILKYFRRESKYSLDELFISFKKSFVKVFG